MESVIRQEEYLFAVFCFSLKKFLCPSKRLGLKALIFKVLKLLNNKRIKSVIRYEGHILLFFVIKSFFLCSSKRLGLKALIFKVLKLLNNKHIKSVYT